MLVFYFPFLRPELCHFSRGALVPFSGECCLRAKVRMVGMLFAVWVLLSVGLPSEQSWTVYDVCARAHIYICVYFCIHLCILKSVSSCQYFQFQSNTTRVILVFSLCIFVTSFFGSKQPGSHYT